jgi:hypothetical protein
MAALAKREPVERSERDSAPSSPAVPKAKLVQPSAKQESLGPGWNHVHAGRVVKATSSAAPHFTPGPVTESPTRNELTTTMKKGKTAMSASKVTVSPKHVPVTKSNKPVNPRKSLQSKPKKRVAQPTQSPIEEITDLKDNLPRNVLWSSLAGSSYPSQPYLQGQLARGLCIKSKSRLKLNMAARPRRTTWLHDWPAGMAAAGNRGWITSRATWDRHMHVDRDPPQVR